MSLEYKLSLEEHERIFKDLVSELESSTKSVDQPEIVILGGQPGCGKGGLIQLSSGDFKNGNAVVINGDEYRKEHPQSNEILKKHEADYAKLTDPDVREWTSKLFAHAINTRRNIIFEGTMRTDAICNTIKRLMNDGYKVTVRVMATNEKESLLGIYERYEAQKAQFGYGRITPQQSHNDAYKGMLSTVEKIENEKLFHTLQVYNRKKDLLYENVIVNDKYSRTPDVVNHIKIERNKKWSVEKISSYKKSWQSVLKLMENREAPNSEIVKVLTVQKDLFVKTLSENKGLDLKNNKESLNKLDQKKKGDDLGR